MALSHPPHLYPAIFVLLHLHRLRACTTARKTHPSETFCAHSRRQGPWADLLLLWERRQRGALRQPHRADVGVCRRVWRRPRLCRTPVLRPVEPVYTEHERMHGVAYL